MRETALFYCMGSAAPARAVTRIIRWDMGGNFISGALSVPYCCCFPAQSQPWWRGFCASRTESPIEDVRVAYFVLLASLFVPEGFALRAAWRSFRAEQGDQGYWETIRDSKDPPVFMTLIEGVAGVMGLIFALSGTFLSSYYGRLALGRVRHSADRRNARRPRLGARPRDRVSVDRRKRGCEPAAFDFLLAAEQPGVAGVNGAFATHLAPDQIVVAMSLELRDSLTAPEIESVVENLEKKMRERHNKVYALFIKPQTRKTYEADGRRP